MSHESGIAVAGIFALALGALIATPAGAQESTKSEDREAIPEIVVVAPLQRRTEGAADAIGARTESIELSRSVRFDDLDLGKYADVVELHRRVANVAESSCRNLDKMFRLEGSGPRFVRTCTREAIQSTEEEIRAAIAAADEQAP